MTKDEERKARVLQELSGVESIVRIHKERKQGNPYLAAAREVGTRWRQGTGEIFGIGPDMQYGYASTDALTIAEARGGCLNAPKKDKAKAPKIILEHPYSKSNVVEEALIDIYRMYGDLITPLIEENIDSIYEYIKGHLGTVFATVPNNETAKKFQKDNRVTCMFDLYKNVVSSPLVAIVSEKKGNAWYIYAA